MNFDIMIGYTWLTNVKVREVTKEAQKLEPWLEFVARMRKHEILQHKMLAPAFIPATHTAGVPRSGNNIGVYTMLVLDIDAGMTIEEAESKFKGLEFLLYTSWSHGLVDKFRMVFPLDQPIDINTYKDMQPFLCDLFHYSDPAAFAASQPFYAPSCSQETADIAYVKHNRGEFMCSSDLINAAYAYRRKFKTGTGQGAFYSDHDLEEVKSLIAETRADIPYVEWRNVGFALANLFGSDAEDLFVEWSLTSPEHNNTEGDLRKVYRGLLSSSSKSPDGRKCGFTTIMKARGDHPND